MKGFLNGLVEDINGNIIAKVLMKHESEQNLIETLISYIKKQNQNDTLVEYASFFHMERTISFDDWILLLKKAPYPLWHTSCTQSS